MTTDTKDEATRHAPTKAEAEVERLKKRTKDAEHRSRVAEKYNTQFCQERDRLRTAIERHKHEYLSAHYPTHIDADRALWATLDPSPDKRVDDGEPAVNEKVDDDRFGGWHIKDGRPVWNKDGTPCSTTPQGFAEDNHHARALKAERLLTEAYQEVHAMTQRHAALRAYVQDCADSNDYYAAQAIAADERMAKGEGEK